MECILAFALIGGAIWFVSEARRDPAQGEILVVERLFGDYDVVDTGGGYVWPWFNDSHRFDAAKRTVELEVGDVRSRDGATFDLALSAHVDIDTLGEGTLDRTIALFLEGDDDHVEQVADDCLEAVVRDVAASMPADEIFAAPESLESASDPEEVLSRAMRSQLKERAISALRDTYGLSLGWLGLSEVRLPDHAVRGEMDTQSERAEHSEATASEESGEASDSTSGGPRYAPGASEGDESAESDASETVDAEPEGDEESKEENLEEELDTDNPFFDDTASIEAGEEEATEPPEPPSEATGGSADETAASAEIEPPEPPEPPAEATAEALEAEIAAADGDETEGVADVDAEFEDVSLDLEEVGLEGEVGSDTDETDDGTDEAEDAPEIDREFDDVEEPSPLESAPSEPEAELDGPIEDDGIDETLSTSMLEGDGLEPYDPGLDDSLHESLESGDDALEPYDPAVGGGEESSSGGLGGEDAFEPYDPSIGQGSETEPADTAGDDALAPYDPAIDDDVVDEEEVELDAERASDGDVS